LEAYTENNLGLYYVDLGETQQALDHLRRALALAREMKIRALEAVALNNLGMALNNAGEQDDALRHFELSLQLRREIGDRAGQANTLNNLGEIHRQKGELRLALEQLTRALELHRAVDNRAAQVHTQINLGAIYRDLGDRQEQLEHWQEALRLSQLVLDRRGEVFALLAVGRARQQLGELETAQEHYARALKLAQEIGDPTAEAEALFGVASGEQGSGLLTEAREHMARAIASLESMGAKIGEPWLRALHLASVRDRYEAYVDLLMTMHARDAADEYLEQALEASEAARARGLLELLREARVDIRQGVDPALLDRERQLAAQLNAKANRQRLISDAGRSDERQRIAREIDALASEYRAVQAELRERSPHYASLAEARPIRAAEIKELLDDQTALLEYSLGDRRSYLWVATSASIEAFQLPPRPQIELLAQRLYSTLTARAENFPKSRAARARRIALADAQAREALAEMSQAVLGPAADRLGAHRLVIVAEGALDHVPFAALPIPSRKPDAPLIVDHEIIHLPSASSLAELRRDSRGRSEGTNLVAVLADPVFDARDPRVKRAKREAPKAEEGDSESGLALRSAGWLARGENLERLVFTRREAEAISALAPGRSFKALDFQASRETATSAQLEQYQVLHFATHAFVNDEHPELSGIVLSLVDRQGKAQDGFLRLHDIYNLKLSAELVTLSGCETGMGKQIRGEGLVGLSRGFMYAGARRVMASLWRVDDAATAELMKHFYRALFSRRQVTAAAALRTAQLELRKSSLWASPFYWSVFTLHGEWRN
jgi:CHAT domain-containing protein/Tfp pilus assembly protein PilF